MHACWKPTHLSNALCRSWQLQAEALVVTVIWLVEGLVFVEWPEGLALIG